MGTFFRCIFKTKLSLLQCIWTGIGLCPTNIFVTVHERVTSGVQLELKNRGCPINTCTAHQKFSINYNLWGEESINYVVCHADLNSMIYQSGKQLQVLNTLKQFVYAMEITLIIIYMYFAFSCLWVSEGVRASLSNTTEGWLFIHQQASCMCYRRRVPRPDAILVSCWKI